MSPLSSVQPSLPPGIDDIALVAGLVLLAGAVACFGFAAFRIRIDFHYPLAQQLQELQPPEVISALLGVFLVFAGLIFLIV